MHKQMHGIGFGFCALIALATVSKKWENPTSEKKLGFFVARIIKLFSKIGRYWMPERSLNQRLSATLIKLPLDNM